MLVILYGPISRVGKACKDYFTDRGFQYVEKLNYAVAPQITTKYGKRNYVSKEEFFENTDSLFRYEVGGILVGFNQKQIDAAVYGNGNSLMTLSTGDISFLAQIKQVYGDQVCLIYTYIDDETLSTIIEEENADADERVTRRQIGRDVKAGYLKHQEIFDHVVIYGGEDSMFNLCRLGVQFDHILPDLPTQEDKISLRYGDVFVLDDGVCYGETMAFSLRRWLIQCGVSVFDDCQLPQGSGRFAAAVDAITHAKIVIPVFSGERMCMDADSDFEDLLMAAKNCGCSVLPLVDSQRDRGTSPLKDVLPRRRYPFVVDWQGDDHPMLKTMAMEIASALHCENTLKKLTREVEVYTSLRNYAMAYPAQLRHYGTCMYALSEDEYGVKSLCLGLNGVAFNSASKVADLLLLLNRREEALSFLSGAIVDNSGKTMKIPQGRWLDRLLICCAHNEMSDEEIFDYIARLFYPNTDPTKMKDSVFANTFEQALVRSADALAQVRNKANSVTLEEASDRETDVANYGAGALELFEGMLDDAGGNLSSQDLMEGYRRVLDYCRYMNVQADVVKQCLDRIDDLEKRGGDEGTYSGVNEALKIFLGQPLPQSGEYDVFLSFKSQDAELATSVYEFLSQNGKKVFFSKVTLPQLGESEYKDAIYDAIDHTKHMVVVASDPDYVKTPWVKREWDTFDSEVLEGRKNGELVLVLSDAVVNDKSKLPTQLRRCEIVKVSEFRERLLAYLR